MIQRVVAFALDQRVITLALAGIAILRLSGLLGARALSALARRRHRQILGNSNEAERR